MLQARVDAGVLRRGNRLRRRSRGANDFEKFGEISAGRLCSKADRRSVPWKPPSEAVVDSRLPAWYNAATIPPTNGDYLIPPEDGDYLIPPEDGDYLMNTQPFAIHHHHMHAHLHVGFRRLGRG